MLQKSVLMCANAQLPIFVRCTENREEEEFYEKGHGKCSRRQGRQQQVAQHAGLSPPALAAVCALHAACFRADGDLPVHPHGRYSDRLHGVQPDSRHPAQRMGRLRALPALPVIPGLHALPDEHPEAERVRSALGLPGADPAGFPAQPHPLEEHQAEDPAGPLHAELHLRHRSLWYRAHPACPHRHDQHAARHLDELHDDALCLPHDLHRVRYLAGRRLGFHHLHGGSVQRQQGAQGSGRHRRRQHHPADQGR